MSNLFFSHFTCFFRAFHNLITWEHRKPSYTQCSVEFRDYSWIHTGLRTILSYACTYLTDLFIISCGEVFIVVVNFWWSWGWQSGDEYHGVPWDDRTFSSWQRVKMPHSLGIMTDERDDLWTKSRAQETITLLTLGFSFLKCWHFVYSSMYLLSTYYMLSFFTTSPWYMSYIVFETMLCM